MCKIYSSPFHISGPFHSYNGVHISSLGNNLMHFLYIFNISCNRNIKMHISGKTHLENLLDISSFYKEMPSEAKCFFKEEYGGTPEEYVLKDLKNVYYAKRLLKEKNVFPENFWVEGWFHACSLMPSLENLKKIPFNSKILKDFESNFKFVEQDESISLHYRGTDFKHHPVGWGDMRVSFDYYKNALEQAKNFGIKTINIFSDQKEDILEKLKIFKDDFDFYFISNSAYLDWYCLFKSKNLISSNSSFCWSAGLYNKNIVFQPKNFLLNSSKYDYVFPTDVYYNNSIVI